MNDSYDMLHKFDSNNAVNDDSKAIMTYKDKSIYNLLQRSRKVNIIMYLQLHKAVGAIFALLLCV